MNYDPVQPAGPPVARPLCTRGRSVQQVARVLSDRGSGGLTLSAAEPLAHELTDVSQYQRWGWWRITCGAWTQVVLRLLFGGEMCITGGPRQGRRRAIRDGTAGTDRRGLLRCRITPAHRSSSHFTLRAAIARNPAPAEHPDRSARSPGPPRLPQSRTALRDHQQRIRLHHRRKNAGALRTGESRSRPSGSFAHDRPEKVLQPRLEQIGSASAHRNARRKGSACPTSPDRGAHEQLERHHRAHRVARQADPGHAAEQPEAHRRARAHAQPPEPLLGAELRPAPRARSRARRR